MGASSSTFDPWAGANRLDEVSTSTADTTTATAATAGSKTGDACPMCGQGVTTTTTAPETGADSGADSDPQRASLDTEVTRSEAAGVPQPSSVLKTRLGWSETDITAALGIIQLALLLAIFYSEVNT